MSDSLWSEKSKRYTFIAITVLSIALIVTILLAAQGVRGTDQYWYFADVITLMEGQPPVSNLYFPQSVIDGGENANYFIHNGPALYLAAIIGGFIGAYEGWLFMNLCSVLIIAACIFFSSLKYTNHRGIALTCCFLFLISPIAVWQSLNMMQEQFFGAVLAIILLSHSYRKTDAGKIIYPLILLLSVAIHPLFTVLTAVYVLSKFYSAVRDRDFATLLHAVFFATAAIFVHKAFIQLFPSNFQPTYTSIIAGSVPDVSSMLWHYSDTLPNIDIAFLLNKFKVAIHAHIWQFPAYFYTNLALIGAAYLMVFGPRQARNTRYILFIILGCYLALSTLMQTQPRYQQIFAPASFLLIALCLDDLRSRLNTLAKNTLFIGTATASLTMSLYLCFTYYHQSKQENYSLNQMTQAFSALPESSRIILNNSEHETKLSYTLRSRKVLSVKEDLIGEEAYHFVVTTFNPDLVISTRPVTDFPLAYQPIKTVSTSYLGDFYLYEIIPNTNNELALHRTAAISDSAGTTLPATTNTGRESTND